MRCPARRPSGPSLSAEGSSKSAKAEAKARLHLYDLRAGLLRLKLKRDRSRTAASQTAKCTTKYLKVKAVLVCCEKVMLRRKRKSYVA